MLDFDSERYDERAAIMEFDGGLSREEAEKATRKHMHECEVRDCIKRFYPDGNAMAEHLAKIEKRRGKEPADKLRFDVRVAWKQEMRKSK